MSQRNCFTLLHKHDGWSTLQLSCRPYCRQRTSHAEHQQAAAKRSANGNPQRSGERSPQAAPRREAHMQSRGWRQM